MSDKVIKGLEGIVVAETRLSRVDGKQGRLYYRGIRIAEFIENGASFEEIVYLLWNGKLPAADELESFKAAVADARELPDTIMDALRMYPDTADPMVVLRTTVSLLAMFDENPDDLSPDNLRRITTSLLSRFPVILATYHRLRQGLDPVAPRTDLGHAANFLYMLNGEEPGPRSVEGMNAYLVLLADHGMNASTFTSRVVAGTQADVFGAISAAIASLKGPLHGGAPPRVMDTLTSVGSREEAEQYVNDALDRGERIMGIGHRVYKTYDPRATILRDMTKGIAQETGNTKWYEIAYAVEEAAVSRLSSKGLYTNVDFYSAPLLVSVGLPADMLTPAFAMSRVAGWSAHLIEQYADNRLIRPRAEYVGPRNVPYAPIEERG